MNYAEVFESAKFVEMSVLFGCDYISDSDDNQISNSLDIYDVWKQLTDLEEDSNGYFHFEYAPSGNYSEFRRPLA